MNPDDIAPSATIMAFAIVVPGVFITCGAKHDEHKTKICVHRPNSRLAHQLSRTSRGRASVPGSHGSAVLAEVPGHLGVPDSIMKPASGLAGSFLDEILGASHRSRLLSAITVIWRCSLSETCVF